NLASPLATYMHPKPPHARARSDTSDTSDTSLAAQALTLCRFPFSLERKRRKRHRLELSQIFCALPFWPQPQENFTTMVAAIGSGLSPRPGRRLIGEYPRLPARLLPRVGQSIILNWTGVAKASLTRPSPTRAVISMAGGIEVEVELRDWPMP